MTGWDCHQPRLRPPRVGVASGRGQGGGTAEQKEIMALLLEGLNLMYPWGIHVGSRGVELTVGQKDWSEKCGSL